MKNPHNYLIRQGKPPLDLWQCKYCKEIGSYEEMNNIECSHIYPPCKICGQTPLCSPTCEGVLNALSNPSIYLSGDFSGKTRQGH